MQQSSTSFSVESLESRVLMAADISDLQSWTGTVTHVADGDTIDVDIDGDGDDVPRRVRMIGVQAMEIGDTNWEIPQNKLKQWLLGKEVTLRAEFEGSTGRKARLLRYVYADINGDGDREDIGYALLKRGLVFAFPNAKETFNNRKYIKAGNIASDADLGLWNPEYCGVGPTTDLSMWAQWDAESNDHENVNGEWIRIRNLSNATLTFQSGWQIRDSALNIYEVPEDTKIQPGKFLTLYVGSGTDTATTQYWGLSEPIFDNIVGDGAYLIDPLGNIRTHFTYPRLAGEDDPLKGTLRLRVNADAAGDDQTNPNGEWVDITNISNQVVDLAGYVLVNWPYNYDIGHSDDLSSRIKPGERMRVYIGSGSETRLKRYWGKSAGILNNTGEVVTVETFDSARIAKYAWGSARV